MLCPHIACSPSVHGIESEETKCEAAMSEYMPMDSRICKFVLALLFDGSEIATKFAASTWSVVIWCSWAYTPSLSSCGRFKKRH